MVNYLSDDLGVQLDQLCKQLDISVKQLRKSGTNYAQAEKDYKMLLRIECLKLRDAGMAIGMIDKVAYGIPSVANARFNRDVAEAVYKANLESINAIKLQMRILENQISREWGSETSG